MHSARKSYVVREEITASTINIQQGGEIKFIDKRGKQKILDLDALATFSAEEVGDTQVVTVAGTLAGIDADSVTPDEERAIKAELLMDLIKEGSLGNWWHAVSVTSLTTGHTTSHKRWANTDTLTSDLSILSDGSDGVTPADTPALPQSAADVEGGGGSSASYTDEMVIFNPDEPGKNWRSTANTHHIFTKAAEDAFTTLPTASQYVDPNYRLFFSYHFQDFFDATEFSINSTPAPDAT